VTVSEEVGVTVCLPVTASLGNGADSVVKTVTGFLLVVMIVVGALVSAGLV
jgi:hypothetical protein